MFSFLYKASLRTVFMHYFERMLYYIHYVLDAIVQRT